MESDTKSTAAAWLAMTSPKFTYAEIAVVVDHGVDRVDLAEHPHDLELLLVQRIALEIALDRERILHEAGAVERADRVGMRHARRDHLAPARVARHEVRLDQSGGDANVGFDEATIEPHRRAARASESEVDVRRVIAREVVLDAHRFEDPWIADDFCELGAFVRPMQARGDENRDAVPGDACVEQAFDQRPQEQAIRHRPRNVADQDAGARASSHHFAIRA